MTIFSDRMRHHRRNSGRSMEEARVEAFATAVEPVLALVEALAAEPDFVEVFGTISFVGSSTDGGFLLSRFATSRTDRSHYAPALDVTLAVPVDLRHVPELRVVVSSGGIRKSGAVFEGTGKAGFDTSVQDMETAAARALLAIADATAAEMGYVFPWVVGHDQ